MEISRLNRQMAVLRSLDIPRPLLWRTIKRCKQHNAAYNTAAIQWRVFERASASFKVGAIYDVTMLAQYFCDPRK